MINFKGISIAMITALLASCGGGGQDLSNSRVPEEAVQAAPSLDSVLQRQAGASGTAGDGMKSALGGITLPPVIAYTDAVTGPVSGGENNLGAYLSLFGSNFGSTQGLGTTTKVYIGGVEVANYRYLGDAKVGSKLGLQQLTVQVGHLGNAAPGTALPVKVVVQGRASNTDLKFAPSAGRILFVALNGNDATAVPDNIAKPWRHLQDISSTTGAYYALQAGDHIVIRGGEWTDATGISASWLRFGSDAAARSGTPKSWIHITAYPGPIKGNAIEVVHHTSLAGAGGGIVGPWQEIAATSGEYVSVSNLHMDVAGGAKSDAAPVNFQAAAGHWRVVNNELGPWIAGNSPELNAAGITGHGDDMKLLGNHIHHIEGTSAQQNHGIYPDGAAQNWEIAYNWVHDISGGSLIQFYDSDLLAGSYEMPHGGLWPGFVGMTIHHNWLEKAAKYGIVVGEGDENPLGRFEAQAWSNVIIGTSLPPVRFLSFLPDQKLLFRFNTVYDCMTTHSGDGDGYVRNDAFGAESGIHHRFHNNIFAFGPHTVPGTQWYFEDGYTEATADTYDFDANIYYTNGQHPDSPRDIGDHHAIVINGAY